MGKGLEQILLQGGHIEGPETYEGCSASLAIREIQIKTTIGTISHQSEWPSEKNVGEDAEKREPWYIVGGNADRCNHCGKQYGISSEN